MKKLTNLLKRFSNVRRLLWLEDRIAELEESKDQSNRDHERSFQRVEQIARRARQIAKAAEQSAQQGELAASRAEQIVNRVNLQLDDLKSSMSVTENLIDEYEAWKSTATLNENPLVSIVIATFNRSGLLLERCLPSVLNQTYPNLEIIVVGDGCTDDTGERISTVADPRLSFIDLDSQLRYPTIPRHRWMVAGTHAMNRGLDLAKGEFVTHLDDDDEYSLDRIEKLVSFASEGEYDFVWHPLWYEESHDNWKLNEAKKFSHSNLTTSSVFYRSWFTKIKWDAEAYRLREPGDWNRFRRIKYIGPHSARFPEPLLKHYMQRY